MSPLTKERRAMNETAYRATSFPFRFLLVGFWGPMEDISRRSRGFVPFSPIAGRCNVCSEQRCSFVADAGLFGDVDVRAEDRKLDLPKSFKCTMKIQRASDRIDGILNVLLST